MPLSSREMMLVKGNAQNTNHREVYGAFVTQPSIPLSPHPRWLHRNRTGSFSVGIASGSLSGAQLRLAPKRYQTVQSRAHGYTGRMTSGRSSRSMKQRTWWARQTRKKGIASRRMKDIAAAVLGVWLPTTASTGAVPAGSQPASQQAASRRPGGGGGGHVRLYQQAMVR